MAKKTEWIYREMLYQALERKQRRLTQSMLARRCGVSIGLVNKALAPLADMNAIEKKPRGFLVLSPKKMLLHWASTRNLRRDIAYQTHSAELVAQIEKEMPPCLFTCYSGFSRRFSHAPADYGEVFVYADAAVVKERFPHMEGKPNIIVLKADVHLKKFKTAPLGQMFVDLWNTGTWYAEKFVKSLDAEIEGLVGGSAEGHRPAFISGIKHSGMHNPAQTEAKLRRLLGGQGFVSHAYLFGSVAKGRAGPLSDIDIAVSLKPMGKAEAEKRKLELAGKIAAALGTDSFDLIVMNNVRLQMRYNIIKDGVMLKDGPARADDEFRIMDEHLDRKYYDDLYCSVFLGSIAERGLL